MFRDKELSPTGPTTLTAAWGYIDAGLPSLLHTPYRFQQHLHQEQAAVLPPVHLDSGAGTPMLGPVGVRVRVRDMLGALNGGFMSMVRDRVGEFQGLRADSGAHIGTEGAATLGCRAFTPRISNLHGTERQKPPHEMGT
eukprot:354356-Chlamydomonas_euryale.AAC.2